MPQSPLHNEDGRKRVSYTLPAVRIVLKIDYGGEHGGPYRTCPRISPLGKLPVWMLMYNCPLCSAVMRAGVMACDPVNTPPPGEFGILTTTGPITPGAP